MNLSAPDILKTMDTTPASLARMSAAKGVARTSRGATAAPGAFSRILKHQAALAKAGAQASDASGLKEEETKRRQQAEKAAGDLISNALILPMLKQLRRSPWGENTVFSRGIGEKTFGPQFDMQISDRIAHSPRLGLKTALTERLLKRGQVDAGINTNHNRIQQGAGGIDLHG